MRARHSHSHSQHESRRHTGKKPAPRDESQPIEASRIASPTSVADAARQRMVSEAAYYRAQKRGFVPGRELDDWLAAETEIAQCFLESEPGAADLH